MIRPILLSVIFTLTLTACGEPKISADCNVNGFGEAKCTFKNEGTAEGSMCVYVGIRANKNAIGYLDGETFVALNQKYTKQDSATSLLIQQSTLLPRNEICSGIVKPADVRQMEKSLDYSIKPQEWCYARAFELDESNSWATYCSQIIMDAKTFKTGVYNTYESQRVLEDVALYIHDRRQFIEEGRASARKIKQIFEDIARDLKNR